jgi:hypothetical protein
MKNIWPASFALSVTLAAAILAGCGSGTSRSASPDLWPHRQPPSQAATVAYTWGISAGNGTPLTILERSVSPGSDSPIATLILPASCNGGPFAVDSAGQLYVACFISAFDSQILIYPPASSGAATPSRTIEVSDSYEITSLTVGATGLLYAGSLDFGEGPGNGKWGNWGAGGSGVAVYSAEASGLATPLRTIKFASSFNNTREYVFYDVAVDAAGNIYSVRTPFASGSPGYIDVYPAAAHGVVRPIRTISLSSAVYGVAVDAAGDVFANACLEYVGCSIERFAPNADGAARPVSTIVLPDQPAGMVFAGGPVRLDGNGNRFASLDFYNPSTGDLTFIVYALGPTAYSTTPIVQMSESDPNNQREFAIN